MKERGFPRQRPSNRESQVSLRFHLIRYLMFFLAIVLMTTWLFQVGLLDVVYEKVREGDMERIADRISDSVGKEGLDAVVYDVSMDELMDVSVYRIDGGRALLLLSGSYLEQETGMPTISLKRMSELYQKASNEGGSCHFKLTFGGHEAKMSIWERLFPEQEDDALKGGMKMVYAHLCNDAAGVEYMVLLSAPMEPLAPMVHTLQRQFVWIFGILLLITVLLAVTMSQRILAPIIHMNDAAKQLASGDYDAEFEVPYSYRETKELAESLNYATRELAKNDKLQKELIANISHDLRTPLTMIRGYGEVMRDIPGENTPENMQVMIDEAQYLTELVNDLLDLSKIQSGVRCPEMEYFNLTEAIREVIARFGAFTKAKGYHISFESGHDAVVFADRGMILQVIYNLIGNALNYTGEDLSVTVDQTVEKGRVFISVRDTGEGIPEDQMNDIWDRYYKVDKVHRMARIGTGLGLSIVKGVLEVHEADFGVRSSAGGGSDFWFSLPISEPAVDQTENGIL